MSAQKQAALKRMQTAIVTVQKVLAYARRDILDAAETDAVDSEGICKKLMDSFKKADATFQTASQELQHLIDSEQALLGRDCLSEDSASEQPVAVNVLKRGGTAAQERGHCPYEAIISEYNQARAGAPELEVRH